MEINILTGRENHSSHSRKQKDIRKYLSDRIMPILGPLQVALLETRPQDIATFCLNYLKEESIFISIQNIPK